MDCSPTRAAVREQYLNFHMNGPHGSDKSSTTQDQSVNLEKNAKDYLCSVKFDKRFSALNFKGLLHEALTASPTPNHLIIKDQIMVGVKNLEKYGLNLLLYPWRKEFFNLKLYSGFFIYNVESKFKPALKILEMFGYQEMNPQELSIMPRYSEIGMEGLRNKIEELVFELFLMSVELSVLVSILQIADQEGYALEDALKSRRRTSGDVEEALQWLKKNVKSSAQKRRKYDYMDDVESLREDHSEEKDKKTEDLKNVKEEGESKLLRHKQNREEFRKLKYPPGIKFDSSSAKYYDSQPPNTQHYENVKDYSRDPVNSEVTLRYADDFSRLVPGYSVVHDRHSEISDADLYGHSGDQPTAGEGLQGGGVNKQHFPVVTTQEFGISNEGYHYTSSFLNRDRSSFQKPAVEPPYDRPTDNKRVDIEKFSSSTTHDLGDYVVIDDTIRQSVGKTMSPRQYPEQAKPMHTNRNLSSNLKQGETQVGTRMGEMKEDLLHLLKDHLNIQYQGSHFSSAEERSNTYPNGSEFGFYDTTADIGKQSRNAHRGSYSNVQQQKQPTYDKGKYQDSGTDFFHYFSDQPGSSISTTSKESTRVSVTAQGSQQSSGIVSGTNQSYGSDRSQRKYVSNVHTTSAISSPLSCAKPSNTALSIKVPPVTRAGMLLQKASEKSLPVKAKQSEILSPSSPIIAALVARPCEHCSSVGSSICKKCRKVSCERCIKIFDTDLCSGEGVKGEHVFVDLTTGQSSNAYSERFSANTTEIRAHGEETEDWNCQRCTLLNPQSNTVCSACASTRGMGEPLMPVTGSKNCLQCTYANPEGAKVCIACHKTMDEFSTNI